MVKALSIPSGYMISSVYYHGRYRGDMKPIYFSIHNDDDVLFKAFIAPRQAFNGLDLAGECLLVASQGARILLRDKHFDMDSSALQVFIKE